MKLIPIIHKLSFNLLHNFRIHITYRVEENDDK